MKKILYLIVFFVCSKSLAQTLALQSFATGFTDPVEITHAGDSRLFVVEQGGLIKILNSNGTVNSTPFLNVSSLISTGGERGLLGLAFPPNYATTGYFFINYTNSAGNTVIARYSVSANPNVANTTGTILMTISQSYSNHNGGTLKFGPDGYLYIGMGDGGSGGDPQNYAQNTTINASFPSRVYLGKMLRIDINSTVSPYYTIPSTNPYVGQAGKEEIWALGLRNPWKFSFNRLNGDLWIADVGQNSVEEIDKVVNPLTAGLNFGWRCYEGNSAYNTTGCLPASSYTAPFVQYARSGGACSVTGGYVYTGTTYPNFQNKYFFTDYCDDKIRMVNTTTGAITTSAAFTGNNFVSFGEDVNGELYLAGITSGNIFKLIDSSLQTNSFEKDNFSIYPNPTQNDLFIKINNQTVKQVEVFDSLGKKVLTKSFTDNEEQKLSLVNLTSGMYFINIEAQDGVLYSTKFYKE